MSVVAEVWWAADLYSDWSVAGVGAGYVSAGVKCGAGE